VNDYAELLERIRNGAPDDFAEVVRRHQSRVFAILHRYERDAHKVEDLAQETFVKAWRALEQFDGRAPFEHWLSRIAVRVALDHLRREKRRQNEIGLPELGEDALDWLRNDDEKSELDGRAAAEILDLALRESTLREDEIIEAGIVKRIGLKNGCFVFEQEMFRPVASEYQLSEEWSETYSERHRSARDRNCLKSAASRCKHVLKTQ
jgi:RNA polymerase sigma-70 factor (ECF subfamily)